MSRLESGMSTMDVAAIIDAMPDGREKHIMKEFFVSVVVSKVNRDLLYDRIKGFNLSFDVTL